MAIKIQQIHSSTPLMSELSETEKKNYAERSSEILESIYIHNFLKIHHYVQDGLGIIAHRDALKHITKDRGAVIVGAGPSLDNDIEILKQHNNDVFIITCDAALPVLKKHNIEPNIIAVIDHSDRQVKNFANQDVNKSFTYMASIVHPLTFDEARRAKARILWYNLFDNGSDLCNSIPGSVGKKGALLPGVLTSSIAMQIAFWLGFRNLAFVGHDLAYVDLDNGYSKDINEEKKKFQEKTKLFNKNDLRIVKDINGDEVHTHSVFLAFMSWLNDNLNKIWKGANLINCSKQGIMYGDRIKQSNLNDFIKIYGKEGYSTECQETLNYIYYSEKQLFDYVVAPIAEGDE